MNVEKHLQCSISINSDPLCKTSGSYSSKYEDHCLLRDESVRWLQAFWRNMPSQYSSASMFSLHFYSPDGSSMFLQNTGTNITGYLASHPIRQKSLINRKFKSVMSYEE